MPTTQPPDEKHFLPESFENNLKSFQGTLRSEPPPREIGGRKGPEPTRYGDWEKNGRCIDF